MNRNKIGVSILVLATLLIGMVLIPAASAQEGDKYSVTAEEAFKHANAHMISFIAADADFEEWNGAFIDPKPLELYDINGEKLYYQFSVYKDNNTIGKIYVCADKKLGHSVKAFEFNPKSFNATEAMIKSIEIAKNKYPTGEIKSTIMVVYSYPSIGAMTVVKDKNTGNEYRIFVDAYSLDIVEDETATETEPGVWSIYEHRLKNGVEEHLKEWQESDQLTKSVEQEATNNGINISVPITEENMQKLTDNSAITLTVTSETLDVPLCGQETSSYCAPASAQMIAEYYDVSHTQDYIHGIMDGPGTVDEQLQYYTSAEGLGKTGSYDDDGNPVYNTLVSEINNGRPAVSMIPGHVRVCRGYTYTSYGLRYLKINDPLPVGSGRQFTETYGDETWRIYVM
ncbi:C39 family peptidase [Methanosarcina mazei]|uniref:Peptidase C39-like domain-containing protein n=4 Tax=Methanosarcina mazei TaxID=2209 RepID=A0A0F8PEC7_METMZ|nr:C39 family peptidase [Methanosarcina mazei]KKH28486.1 hypothetical protein DU37_08195 [Methanosarcina mazei]